MITVGLILAFIILLTFIFLKDQYKTSTTIEMIVLIIMTVILCIILDPHGFVKLL